MGDYEMTRKDYEKFADMIRGTVTSLNNDVEGKVTGNNVVAHIAMQMIRIFANDNPRFDENKFLKACNLID